MVLSRALGVVVGVIMGLTGAGGGILPPSAGLRLAIVSCPSGAIGLLAVGISATLGAMVGLKNDIVRYRAALLVAGTGIVLAPLGVWLAQRLNSRVLSVLFAAVLAWVTCTTFKESRPK